MTSSHELSTFSVDNSLNKAPRSFKNPANTGLQEHCSMWRQMDFTPSSGSITEASKLEQLDEKNGMVQPCRWQRLD